MTDRVDTSAEAVERLAAERSEKAAESFMIAQALRDADRDPSGFVLAGQQAALTAATLRALLVERDEARFAPLGDNHHSALRCPHCNPERIDPAAERTARQRAEAELGLAELRAEVADLARINAEAERDAAQMEATAARQAEADADAEAEAALGALAHFGAPMDDRDAAIAWIKGLIESETRHLREQRDELRGLLVTHEICADKMKADAARMREALLEIVQHCNNSGYGCPIVDNRTVDRCEETALAALGGTGHE